MVTKNGKVYIAEQKDLPSLTAQQILQKFKMLAADRFEQKRIDELVSKINKIEQLDNISEIINLLKSDNLKA